MDTGLRGEEASQMWVEYLEKKKKILLHMEHLQGKSLQIIRTK